MEKESWGKLYLFGLFLMTFAFFTYTSNHVVPRERPYEERVIESCMMESTSWEGSDDLWFEHPQISLLPWYISRLLPEGPGRRILARLITAGLYSTSIILFATLIRCLQRRYSIPESASNWIPAILYAAGSGLSSDTLNHACRADGLAVAAVSFVALLFIAMRLSTRTNITNLILSACFSSLLSWSHCYGFLISITVFLTVLLEKAVNRREDTSDTSVGRIPELMNIGSHNRDDRRLSPRPFFSLHSWLPILVLLSLQISFLFIPSFRFRDRTSMLCSHYWSDSWIDTIHHIPFGVLWIEACAFPLYRITADLIQAGAFLFIGTGFLWCFRKTGRIPFFSTIFLLSLTGTVCYQYFAGSHLVIPQFTGLFFTALLLAAYETAALLLGSIGIWFIALFSLTFFSLPSLLILSEDGIGGDKVLTDVKQKITNVFKPDDIILFSGSRPYFMFYPELTNEQKKASIVYLRTGGHPDIFPGRHQIPTSRRYDEDRLLTLSGSRIVVVQLEAAQTVFAPLPEHTLVEYDAFIFPSPAIRDIHVMTFSPVRHN